MHSLRHPSAQAPAREVRIHALRALAEIRDHRAIPILMKVKERDSALLQHRAKEGLDRLGLHMVYIKLL
jgi:HEAT repeat protein